MINPAVALTKTSPVAQYSINRKRYIETTDSNGYFTLKLDLQPEDDKNTTYEVTANFEGDEPQSATAYATAPDGTQYPVCTTLQYFGYKPSSASAWLTVEPQTPSLTRLT